MEFLTKIYWANFFPWAEKAKKGWYTGNRTGPAPGTGWAGRPVRSAQVGPGGVSPWIFPGLLLFDFLFRLESFKGSFE
jgi:hypothetical protein